MVGVYEGNAWGIAQEGEPLTLTRSLDATVVGCHSYMKPLGLSLSVAEPIT